jgi:hypothetical protein
MQEVWAGDVVVHTESSSLEDLLEDAARISLNEDIFRAYVSDQRLRHEAMHLTLAMDHVVRGQKVRQRLIDFMAERGLKSAYIDLTLEDE